MANKPISTRPLNGNEILMREKFYETITAQSDLMDKLSERLLTLELAIPGLCATVLKLMRGDKAMVAVNIALYITFACWLLALIVPVKCSRMEPCCRIFDITSACHARFRTGSLASIWARWRSV